MAFAEAGKDDTRDGVAHSKAILFMAADWGSDPEHPQKWGEMPTSISQSILLAARFGSSRVDRRSA